MKYALHILFSYSIFAFISLYFGVNGINPSDPLEYLIPIFNDEIIFPYLDRILLGAGLKALSKIIADTVTISYVFPIIIYFFIHAFACLNILKSTKDIKVIYIFTILIICSPFNVATFTYIYPSTFMLLFLTLGAYIHKRDGKDFGVGVLIPFLAFSKIQGISFVINVFATRGVNWRKLFAGISVGFVFFYIFISLIFYDINYLYKVMTVYFNEYAAGQVRGYGGVLPPFSMYFTEPYVLFISLLVLYNWGELNAHEKNIFFIGLAQASLLIFIYLISQRGGALIPNYIAPAFYLITLSVSSKIPTGYLNSKYVAYVALCTILGIVYAEWGGGFQYFATNNHVAEFLFCAVLLAIFLHRRGNAHNQWWVVAGMIIVPIFSYKAQSEALSRINWSRPFTDIYSIARSFNEKTFFQFDGDNSYLRRFNMIGNLDNRKIFQACDDDCRSARNYLTNNVETAFKHFDNSSIHYIKSCVRLLPRSAIVCGNRSEGSFLSGIRFINESGAIELRAKNIDINSLYRFSYYRSSQGSVPVVLYGVIAAGNDLRLEMPIDAINVEFSYYDIKKFFQVNDFILFSNE